MRALHRKLLRDFVGLKGQMAAIGVVIAAGVMTLLISLSTLDALQLTRARYYQDYKFADVFADLKRAPDGLIERLREIPGIDYLETRVRAPVRIDVAGFADPVRGDAVSIPDGSQPELNRLHIREGRLPLAGRSDEVAVSEPFARAHGLRPGDSLRAIIRGGYEELTIVGIALSPEFVYQVGPADLLPDHARYAVLWMNRRALANAFAMEGAFNNVVLTLHAGTSEQRVIEALDLLLDRYGGVGAYGREDQNSHRFLSEEIDQLRVMASILPTIFLGVAAFLLHVLMNRIIRLQREQIAVLKAFGYSNAAIGAHYAMLTGTIVLVGSVAGAVLGQWAGEALAGVYEEYFQFPELITRFQPRLVLLAVGVAGGSATAGTFAAVRSAVKLPPAEAMRPPPPERYRRGWIESSAAGRLLGQPTRIIIRNLSRHPLKSTFSIAGIALSASLLLVGSFQFGAVEGLIDTQYRLVLNMDVDVVLTDPVSERAVTELRHLPGVRYVEGYRSAPVRLVSGTSDYRTAIVGTEAGSTMRRLLDRENVPVVLPEEGLFLTRYLADYLGVGIGESVQVEILEGRRETVRATLAGVVDEPVGVSGYMERRALNRMLKEGPSISGAWLLTDPAEQASLYRELWELPSVAGIGTVAEAARNIRDYMKDTVLIFMGILLVLAGSIAFAVVYNNARITFAERARELATLRVLGFTRGEVAWILVGEIGILTAVAIPAGWGIGIAFAWTLNHAMAMDIFRIPFVMTARPLAFSAGGVVVASTLALLLMIRRLFRLDMVSALKSVE